MTLTSIIRQYLRRVAVQDAATSRKRRERETLERSFVKLQFKVGKRTWKRTDLYERA